MDRLERRRYFRINDWVGLSYRAVDNTTDAVQEAANVQIATLELLRGLDKEIQATLNILWQNNSVAATALNLINRKLDLLAAELDLDYSGTGGATLSEMVQVNISACGMAFESDERFKKGHLLELVMTLKPTNRKLKLLASVIACEDKGGDKPYLLRLDFYELDASAEEELIQHIVKRQSGQLAMQRGGKPEQDEE